MRHDVRVFCSPELAPGFVLAGATVEPISDPLKMREALERWAQDPRAGVALIEESLHRSLPDEVLVRISRRGIPILTAFPGPKWAEKDAAESYVLQILRRAIGYRVRPT